MPTPTFEEFCLHKLSQFNRDAIEQSDRCECFHCRRIFTATEGTRWCTVGDGGRPTTALCPHCGVDAILPSKTTHLTPELLERMHAVWFTREPAARRPGPL